MSFTVLTVDQRSPEWFAARCGRLTSSCAKVLFTEGRKKGEESVQRRDLRIRLALERITHRTQDNDGFLGNDVQRGIDREVDARLAYEAATGTLVRQAGFLKHTEHMVGSSLDGYIGDFEGVVELKCPKSATHLGYLRAKAIPKDYLPQIQHHVWVSGAEWADFVSFDDRLPENGQLAIYRVLRKQLDIPRYEAFALEFLEDVKAEKREIEALVGAASEAA